jgi:hypothetical protein
MWLFLHQVVVVVGEQHLDMVGGRNNITNPLKYTVQINNHSVPWQWTRVLDIPPKCPHP